MLVGKFCSYLVGVLFGGQKTIVKLQNIFSDEWVLRFMEFFRDQYSQVLLINILILLYTYNIFLLYLFITNIYIVINSNRVL